MVDVRPFRGLRYDLERVGPLSSVITPPYDVITANQQRGYHQRSPHNIIRLEFGEDSPEDVPGNSKYTRAATTLQAWLREGILFREEMPSFYVIEHNVPCGNNGKSHWGLIAAVRLEDISSGRILPTEVTMREPAIDRLNLLRSCRANLSSVMVIFNEGTVSLRSVLADVQNGHPSARATDDAGVTHNLWTVHDEHTIGLVSRFFADKVLYIADGHHRYKTACAYRDEQRSGKLKNGGNEAFDFMMMTLLSAQDSCLTLEPMHRLIKGVQPEKLDDLAEKLADYFIVEEIPRHSPDLSQSLSKWLGALREAGSSNVAFGLYGLMPGRFHLLVPHNTPALRDKLPAHQPMAWRNLDVSLLHGVILNGMLGIYDSQKERACLDYSHDAEAVAVSVSDGAHQFAVFLNPPTVTNILAVADAGARMPQKSSYFYPKTPAGLVINPLWGDVPSGFSHEGSAP